MNLLHSLFSRLCSHLSINIYVCTNDVYDDERHWILYYRTHLSNRIDPSNEGANEQENGEREKKWICENDDEMGDWVNWCCEWAYTRAYTQFHHVLSSVILSSYDTFVCYYCLLLLFLFLFYSPGCLYIVYIFLFIVGVVKCECVVPADEYAGHLR